LRRGAHRQVTYTYKKVVRGQGRGADLKKNVK